MITARVSKAAERLVKLTDLDVTPEYVGRIIEEAAKVQELEDERDKFHSDVINMTIRLDKAMDAIKGLLADGSNGSARTLAQMALIENGAQ